MKKIIKSIALTGVFALFISLITGIIELAFNTNNQILFEVFYFSVVISSSCILLVSGVVFYLYLVDKLDDILK
jgi:uncharacterized membrane protein YjjP (DUF1212 family)